MLPNLIDTSQYNSFRRRISGTKYLVGVARSATLSSEDRGTGERTASIALGWGVFTVLEDTASASTESCAVVVIASLLVLWHLLVRRAIKIIEKLTDP